LFFFLFFFSSFCSFSSFIMTDCAQFIEDLDLSRVCIPNVAEQNKNNNVISTTKVCMSPDDSDAPTGQMSFFSDIKYIPTPGKDKTIESHPAGNRNFDLVIKGIHKSFLDQIEVLNKVALEHAKKHRKVYWPKDKGMTDRDVEKKHRKLIVVGDDGARVFRVKCRPSVRKNKNKELVPSSGGTVMIEVVDGEDAEEPTDIDQVHNDDQQRDQAQCVCRFVCFYVTSTWFGINPICPQGWHRRMKVAAFSRNKSNEKARPKKRAIADVSAEARGHDEAEPASAQGRTDTAPEPEVVQVQVGGASKEEEEDDVEDEYDDTDDYE
jgi:hypothetical protein